MHLQTQFAKLSLHWGLFENPAFAIALSRKPVDNSENPDHFGNPAFFGPARKLDSASQSEKCA